MTTLAFLFAGLAAATIHVLSGADHLAAVATLSSVERRRAWRLGAQWGLGHATGVAVVAAIGLSLRSVLPVDTVSSWSERLVGLTLIGIGLWAIGRAVQIRRGARGVQADHAHLHADGDSHRGGGHAHLHSHGGIVHEHEHRHHRPRAAYLVGLLHGTAGGGHVASALPALALPSAAAAVAYLAGFGIGTIAVMGGFAASIGAAANRLASAGPWKNAALAGGCGALSVLVGALWLAL